MQIQDYMYMVGHYHIFVHPYIGEVLLDPEQSAPRNLATKIQFFRTAKQT